LGLFLAAILATPLLAADFEGVVDIKMSMVSAAGVETSSGTSRISITKDAMRNDVFAQTLLGPVRTVTLVKAENPNLLYKINDQAKTYSEIDLSQPKPPEPPDAEPYQVKRLGEEQLLGCNALHLLVTYKNTSNELWATKELLDSATFRKLLARTGRTGAEERMTKAMKDAGIDGMPLKSILTAEDGSKTTMQVVQVEKKNIPAWTFEIPAGYEKVSAILEAAGDFRAQQEQRRLEQMMQKLPPDKRAMLESALKQKQQQSPP